MSVLSDEEIKQINSAFEETAAFEMAFTRKEVISRTQAIGRQFCYHLLKCALYPKSESLNHWLDEMGGWFRYVCDLTIKPDNKRLDSTTFLNQFIIGWIEFSEDVSRFAKKLQAEYGKAIFDEQALFLKIKELCKHLVKMYDDDAEKAVFKKTMQQWLAGT